MQKLIKEIPTDRRHQEITDKVNELVVVTNAVFELLGTGHKQFVRDKLREHQISCAENARAEIRGAEKTTNISNEGGA